MQTAPGAVPSSSNWRFALWTLIAALLLLPLVAMQFTDEVAWDAADFAAAAIILVGAGVTWEILARKLSSTSYRLIAGGLLVVVVLLVWAEGAVGIFT